MKLAYVSLPGRGKTDDLIAEVVQSLTSKGVRLAGVARLKPANQGGHPCDMELSVLPDGPSHWISQRLGQGAKGCRLDGGTIEQIAIEVESRVAGAELLIINKFGKQEAKGRGLCSAMTKAMSLDIPVLVGVNDLNTADFLTFADGLAEFLEPSLNSVQNWITAHRINPVKEIH